MGTKVSGVAVLPGLFHRQYISPDVLSMGLPHETKNTEVINEKFCRNNYSMPVF